MNSLKLTIKKVLHKVKKQWVTISIAMLGMLGLGAISYTSVSAHQTQQPATLASRITKNLNSAQGRKVPQDKEYNVNNPQFIDHQAKNLHAHLMRLSALSDDDNAKNNSQKTSVQDKSEQNDNRVDQQKNNSANVPSATFTGDNNRELSLTVVFHDNQNGKNYSDTWKAHPGELIVGPPNGTKYQLAGQQGQPYLYHFSDVDHLHPLNSYTKRNPNLPSNDHTSDAFISLPSNGPSNGGKGGNGGHNGH